MNHAFHVIYALHGGATSCRQIRPPTERIRQSAVLKLLVAVEGVSVTAMHSMDAHVVAHCPDFRSNSRSEVSEYAS